MPAIRTLAFFGTPEFAVPTLGALEAAGRRPAVVVTQPSRPAGRGGAVQDPPVARWARARGLPVLQPQRVRDPGFLAALRELAPDPQSPPDIAVVVAFGQIFPRELLDLPPHGCINLHASLLPRWRGAAPIQAAIAAGDTTTGVSTMRMEQGLDSGPILLQREVEIGPDETAGELAPRLARIGGELVVETLERLEAGDLTPREQRHEEATYAPRLARDSGRVDWSLDARRLADRLRAYTPWPGLTAELGGRPVKLVHAAPLPGSTDAAPGTFLGLAGGLAAIASGGGTVLGVGELQRPGRRALAAADFVNGERLAAGERLS